MIALLQKNWSLVLQVLSVLWTVLSMINGRLKHPGAAKTLLGGALDLISFLTRSDSPNTLKLPLASRSRSPSSLDQSSGGSSVVAFLPFFLVSTLLIGACGALAAAVTKAGPVAQTAGIDIAKCAIGEVPAAVTALIPEVVQNINASASDWSNEIAKLEDQGMDVALCAIEAVVTDLTNKHEMFRAANLTAIDRGLVALTQLHKKAGH